MSDPLGFLVSDVARLMRRGFDERARSIGVTRPQWRVLTLLSRNESINQAGLAELLEVEPITLARMIDRLQEAGLVERRPDPGDRRARRLHLTPAARDLLDRLRGLGDDLFAESVAGLETKDQARLTAMLEVIRANLSRRSQSREAAHG